MADGTLPPFQSRQLIILAAMEFAAVLGLVARMIMNVPWANPPGYAWFIGTLLLGMASVGSFVVRSVALHTKAKFGEDVRAARGQVFAASVVLAVGALVLSAAGPGVVAMAFAAAGLTGVGP